MSTYVVQHQVGQKQYELTNHLGNVQATVSDLPYAGGEYYITRKAPALPAVYDYYPFGMLMPGRYTSDTTGKCMTISQTKWVTNWMDSCYLTPALYTATIGGAVVNTTGGTLNVSTSNVGDGIELTLAGIVPGVEQELNFEFEEVYRGTPQIWVTEEQNGVQVSLGSVLVRDKGTTTLRVKSKFGNIKVLVLDIYEVKMKKVCVKVPQLIQQEMLVDVCSDMKDRYRFGFNGQEKVNEWSGVGNFMDYTWRGYDTRVARFISKDPLMRKFPYYAPYQFAGNTPIQAIDLDGREELHFTTKTWKDGDGNTHIETKESTEINALGHGSNGIWMTDINEVEGSRKDWYIPDAIIQGTRIHKDTDPRSGFEKGAERMLTWMFTVPMNQAEKLDQKMESAEYVGFRLKYAYEDGSNSLKGSIGVQSSSENNFWFAGSNGFERKGGLSSKGPPLGFKLQLGFYWKQKDNSFKTNFGSVDGKVQGYSKVSLGPFGVERNGDGTDEATITLGKNAFKKADANAEVGVKAVAEKKWQSKVYNLK